MITDEMLFKETWLLNPLGDEPSALFYFEQAIRIKKTKTGEPITGQYLLDRYTEYVESLKQYQNGKYTKRQYQINNLEEWLDKDQFNQIIVKPPDPLEFYLYGI
jgi:hypothetical protein